MGFRSSSSVNWVHFFRFGIPLKPLFHALRSHCVLCFVWIDGWGKKRKEKKLSFVWLKRKTKRKEKEWEEKVFCGVHYFIGRKKGFSALLGSYLLCCKAITFWPESHSVIYWLIYKLGWAYRLGTGGSVGFIENEKKK